MQSHTFRKLLLLLSFPHKTNSLTSSLYVSQIKTHLLFFVFSSVFFAWFFEVYSIFVPRATLVLLYTFLCSTVGFKTQTHATSSTMSFNNLAFNKCNSSLNTFLGSVMISVCLVLLTFLSTIFHLIKISQQ